MQKGIVLDSCVSSSEIKASLFLLVALNVSLIILTQSRVQSALMSRRCFFVPHNSRQFRAAAWQESVKGLGSTKQTTVKCSKVCRFRCENALSR